MKDPDPSPRLTIDASTRFAGAAAMIAFVGTGMVLTERFGVDFWLTLGGVGTAAVLVLTAFALFFLMFRRQIRRWELK